MPWTESTLEQVLVLSWLRTVGELTEMAEIHGILITVLFNDLSLSTPPYGVKPSIKVFETRGLKIALG